MGLQVAQKKILHQRWSNLLPKSLKISKMYSPEFKIRSNGGMMMKPSTKPKKIILFYSNQVVQLSIESTCSAQMLCRSATG